MADERNAGYKGTWTQMQLSSEKRHKVKAFSSTTRPLLEGLWVTSQKARSKRKTLISKRYLVLPMNFLRYVQKLAN